MRTLHLNLSLRKSENQPLCRLQKCSGPPDAIFSLIKNTQTRARTHTHAQQSQIMMPSLLQILSWDSIIQILPTSASVNARIVDVAFFPSLPVKYCEVCCCFLCLALSLSIPSSFLFSLPVLSVQCCTVALPIDFNKDCNRKGKGDFFPAEQICFATRRYQVFPNFMPKPVQNKK